MALKACDECKGQVSDLAATCPHCGSPVVSEVKDHAARVGYNNSVAALLFFGPILWLALTAYLEGPEAMGREFGWAKWAIGAGVLYYFLSEFGRNLAERKMRRKAAGS